MRKEITQDRTTKIMSLNKNDPTYQARQEYFENKIEEDLDVVDSFEQNLKMGRKKRKF